MTTTKNKLTAAQVEEYAAKAERLLKRGHVREANALLKIALEQAPWETPKAAPPAAPKGYGTAKEDNSGLEASSPDPRKQAEDPSKAIHSRMKAVYTQANQLASRLKGMTAEVGNLDENGAKALMQKLKAAGNLMQKVLAEIGAG